MIPGCGKITLLCLCLSSFSPGGAWDERASSLEALVPHPPGWTLSGPPRTFVPATLFEYIDGAAESYLSYAFRELLVADYERRGRAGSLTVEIYDMEKDVYAFGIYSAERYPESRFLKIGNQGYQEDGTLNFIGGRFYIKLLCADCGMEAASTLTAAAGEIEKRITEMGRLPRVLDLFPKHGLVANSERFALRNALGFGFLHDGYVASYKMEDREFECFIIEGENDHEAAEMLERYLESQRKAAQTLKETEFGYHLRDRYLHNVFLSQQGKFLVGVMRIPDGSEGLGVACLNALKQSVRAESGSGSLDSVALSEGVGGEKLP